MFDFLQKLCDSLGWEAELDQIIADIDAIPAEETWKNLVAQDESERARLGRLAAAGGGAEPQPGVRTQSLSRTRSR